MAISKFHGSIPIDAGSNNATFTQGANPARTITVSPNGEWFIRAYTAEAIAAGRAGAQLVEEIQARLVGFAEFATFTAVVSDAGIVTLTNGSAFTVTWDDAELRNILGYTGNLTPAATSFAAPNQHKYGFYPSTALREREGDERSSGVATADVVVNRPPSGQVITTAFAEFTDREFAFGFLPREYMFAVLSSSQATRVVNRSYEEFWRQVLRTGRRFRWYPDRVVQTATGGGAPFEYQAEQVTAKAGTKTAERVARAWDELYHVPMMTHGYVP